MNNNYLAPPSDTQTVFSLGNYDLNATTDSITQTSNDTTGGQSWLEKIASSIPSLGNSAANVINALKGNPSTVIVQQPQQKKNDYTMIIMIIVALFVLIILGMLLFKRR